MPPARLPDLTAFYIQEIGALLFGLVFLFLYRQSRVVYFGLWAVAWVLRLLAAFFGFELLRTAQPGWLAPYATFEFAFAIVLISAARAGFASGIKDWRTVLRLISILPIFVALVWAFGLYSRLEAYHASHALVLSFVYLYNFFTLRRSAGIGARVFRFSLLVLAAVFLEHAMLVWYLYDTGGAPAWALTCTTKPTTISLCTACWRSPPWRCGAKARSTASRDLRAEVDHLRRESEQGPDLDHLTGLLNQAALARRVEEPADFEGVVAVCDMDNFKDVNDRYGHLVGDEILRNIGNLLHSSIRHEDEAFRWGGDEFVILFHNQRAEVARTRMSGIEARLRDFRVRGYGALPISFSWGTADAHGRTLRDALDEADRNMYALKRTRARAPGPPRERAPEG